MRKHLLFLLMSFLLVVSSGFSFFPIAIIPSSGSKVNANPSDIQISKKSMLFGKLLDNETTRDIYLKIVKKIPPFILINNIRDLSSLSNLVREENDEENISSTEINDKINELNMRFSVICTIYVDKGIMGRALNIENGEKTYFLSFESKEGIAGYINGYDWEMYCQYYHIGGNNTITIKGKSINVGHGPLIEVDLITKDKEYYEWLESLINNLVVASSNKKIKMVLYGDNAECSFIKMRLRSDGEEVEKIVGNYCRLKLDERKTTLKIKYYFNELE